MFYKNLHSSDPICQNSDLSGRSEEEEEEKKKKKKKKTEKTKRADRGKRSGMKSIAENLNSEILERSKSICGRHTLRWLRVSLVMEVSSLNGNIAKLLDHKSS